MQSTVCITAEGIDYTYRFAGVTAVEYSFALNVGTEAAEDEDLVHGARKLPDRIRLSVVETDVNGGAGRAASMLRAMDSIRRTRTLCRVVTSMGAWESMLLTEITATEDEASQCGWTGDLCFVQYTEKAAPAGTAETSAGKAENNSSTRKNTGTKAAAGAVSGTAFQQLLARSGVSGEMLMN